MKMKKFITIIISSIILSSAMAAETGQRILENNYEKKRSNIGNKLFHFHCIITVKRNLSDVLDCQLLIAIVL